MKKLVQEKKRAVQLRKRGYSYSDISAKMDLSKSTLSNWLKDLPLTNEERAVLKKSRDAKIDRGRIRAAASLRKQRLVREKIVYLEAEEMFQEFINTPFFHFGVALYWAEGSKRQSQFGFINSDPEMIETMVLWIDKFLIRSRTTLKARLYIHKPYAFEQCEEFWAHATGIPLSNFKRTIYKPSSFLVKKRPNYKGCMRLDIPKSRNCLLKMLFWQHMLVVYYKKHLT